jgi:hypothetical protein
MNCASEVAGMDGCTTSPLGVVPMRVIDAKSRSASYGSFA